MRASTRCWSRVWGSGMNSPFETIWVGMGEANAAISAGAVRVSPPWLSEWARADLLGTRGYRRAAVESRTRAEPSPIHGLVKRWYGSRRHATGSRRDRDRGRPGNRPGHPRPA